MILFLMTNVKCAIKTMAMMLLSIVPNTKCVQPIAKHMQLVA